MRVGDSSRLSEEIVKNLDSRLSVRLLSLLLLLLLLLLVVVVVVVVLLAITFPCRIIPVTCHVGTIADTLQDSWCYMHSVDARTGWPCVSIP